MHPGRLFPPPRRAPCVDFALRLTVVVWLAMVVLARPVRAEAPFSAAVAAQLQPLRGQPDRKAAFAPALEPMRVAYAKRSYAAACTRSAAHFGALMARGAQIFYGVDRRKGDTAAISQFLAQHASGERPELEVGQEGFMPAVAWRNLAVDACVRAGNGAAAVRMVAQAGSETDGPARIALAVALAVQAGRWSAGQAALTGTRDALRLSLWQALLQPTQGRSWLAKAASQAQTADDRALVDAVAALVGAKTTP